MHPQPTLVTATLYTVGVPVWPLVSRCVTLVTACGHCAGLGWAAVGAGLGCCHQPALGPSQPGRLSQARLLVAVLAGGRTPWHSAQRHTTGCNTLHYTPQLAWLLAPLASPSIAHYTGSCSRVSCTVAVWGHAGMEQESPRLPCPELPRCSQAVESSGQQQPAHSSGQRGHDQGQESVGGRVHPRVGGSEDLQHVTSCMSPAAAAGGAAGGGGGAVLLPAVSLSTGAGCSAPRLLRRWNDNNLTIT